MFQKNNFGGNDRWQQENVVPHFTRMSGMDMDAVSPKVHVCSFFQIVNDVPGNMARAQMPIMKMMKMENEFINKLYNNKVEEKC